MGRQTYILHVNYEIIQTCNEYKNSMHNMSGGGVFLKTNVVLGGVQASVTKRHKGLGILKNVKICLTYFMDSSMHSIMESPVV